MKKICQSTIVLISIFFIKMSLLRFIFLVFIAMYSTTLSSQCANPITSFPISDDFEMSIGNWNQDYSDDFDWTLDSGGTASSGTGPTAGNGGSTWYMYTEASSPNDAGKVANLISPCFAVAGTTTFAFGYHMYSASTMGTFNVDVRINGSGVWTNIWTRTGNQGNAWLDESIILDAYTGQNIELRYSVITNTFRSDIAIDDVTITQTVVEICDNGIDDNGDGLIDMADPDCSTFIAPETLPLGTLIIPMGNSFQSSQIRAYGLAVLLLHANIPLKWIIEPTKSKDGIDFSANSRRIYPSSNTIQVHDFRAGPLAILPGFETQAAAIINSHNAGGSNVDVYELQQSVSVPVFATLIHKPRALVGFDNAEIHTSIFSAAGLSSGTHYAEGDTPSLTSASCFTLATQPHDDAITLADKNAVGDFVQGGGNFFAQCAAVRGYTQQGLLANYQGDGNTGGSLLYDNHDEPMAQFQGTIDDEGGSLVSLKITSNPGRRIVYSSNDGARYKAYVGNLALDPGITAGGYVHFLGGHEHDSDNGKIMVLNALLCPADRPEVCGLTISPEANDDQSVLLNCGEAVSIDVLANDINPVGGTPTISLLTSGSNGIFSVSGTTIQYLPNSGYWSGIDVATYQICDYNNKCSQATITVVGDDNIKIGGVVFVDSDQDAFLDMGENGPNGVTVNLYDDVNNNDQVDGGDTFLESQNTTSGGVFQFLVTDSPSTTMSSTISTSKATSHYEGSSDDGYGACEYLYIEEDPDYLSYAFMEFNLASVNSACPVTSATLTIKKSDYNGGGDDFPFSIKRVTRSWTEGSGSCSGNSSGLTWDDYNGSNSWTTSGGDFSSTIYATATGGDNDADGTTYTFDITTLVNEWNGGTFSNHGLAIVPTSPGASGGYDYFAFYSDDAAAANRPSLSVTTTCVNASDFVMDINTGTLPSGSTLTTDNVEDASFTALGIDCDNNFGFITCIPLDPGTNGALTICEGESVTIAELFTSLGGSPDAGGVWTPALGGADTYTYTHAATAECPELSAQVVVTEQPPLDPGTNGVLTICEGETVTASELFMSLGGSPDVGGVWTPALGGADTYTYTYVATGECPEVSAQVVVTVSPLPVANISGNTNICELEVVIYTADNAGVLATYSWGFGADATPSTAAGIGPHNVTYINVGVNGLNEINDVSLTVTNGNGCINTDEQSFSIYKLPEVTTSSVSPACGIDDGSITFSFPDNPSRTNIEFSIDGGVNYPYDVSDNIGTYTISLLTSGTYDLHVRWGNTQCPIDLSDITLLDNTMPIAGAGSDVEICLGESTTLTANGIGTYTWSDGGTNANLTVSPNTTTTYTVTVTAVNGCTDTDEVQVIVNPLPNANVNHDGTLTCNHTSALLTTTPTGLSYIWTGGGTNQTLSVSTGDEYFVTVTDGNGCTAVTSITVPMDTLSPLSNAGPDVEICLGESTTLTASGIGTYTWSDGSTSSSLTVTPIATITYTLTVTATNGCMDTDQVTITVNSLPNANVSHSGDITCNDPNTILTATPAGMTYEWTGGSAAQTLVVSTGDEYFVTVTDGNLCSAVASISVPMDTISPVANAGNNVEICLGESTTLLATGIGTYTWSDGSTSSSLAVTPIVTATYTLTVTSNNGCEDIDEVIVTANPLPNAGIDSDGTITCDNTSVTLTATPAGMTYLWSTGEGTSSIDVNVDGNYSVTITDGNSCANFATTTVTTAISPVAVVTGAIGICIGETTTLTPNTGGEWTSSNESVAIVSNNGNVIGISGGIVVFTFEDNSTGCTDISETITVSSEMSIVIDYIGGVCLTDDSQLGVNISGGTPDYTYSWTGPNSFTASSQTIDINENGNYYLTVTDALGCDATTSGFVYAAFNPFIFSLETSVCEGESVDLEINGSNIISYAWDTNAGSATTSSVTVTPSAPYSTYIVTVTNTNGCTATGSATIGAEVLPTAEAGADVNICENETVLISTADEGAGISYAWNFGADASPSAASGFGPHNVTYTNPNTNGANKNNTVTLTVTKGDCTNDDTKNVLIKAQPDPTVSFSSPSCGVDDGSITFGFLDNPDRTDVQFSMDGGTTFPYTANDNVGTYTVIGLASGDYNLYAKWIDDSCPLQLSNITLADNEIPTISNTGDDTICIGLSTIVNASTTGTWTSDDENIATVSAAGVVLGVTAGVANINFTADNNCSSTTIIQITVTDPEGVNITGDNILCEGISTTLIASQIGGSWSSSDNNIATVNTSGVVIGVGAGDVLISYEYPSSACKVNASLAIEVFSKPTVTVSGSDEVCVGETTTLSTDGSGGYWTSSDDNIAIVSSAGLVSGLSVGDVTFYYTNGSNCPSSSTGTVTVTPIVSVTIDFNGSECLTLGAQLSAIVTGGASGYTYAWTGPGGFTGNTQTLSIFLDGNYNVMVTDSKGCSEMTSVFVYEAYEPFILALNTTVCEGESVTFSISGASATSYQWSASAGSATTQSVTVIPSVPSTSYTVTITNSIGCTNEAMADIIVDPKPVIEITGSSDICVGEITQLSPTTGGKWTSGNSSVASVTDAGMVTGIINGTTTFTFKSDATGCVSDPTGTINVRANEMVTITGDNQICFFDNTTLIASVSGGSWSSSNVGAAIIDSNGVITPQGQGSTTIIYDFPEGDCYENGNYMITIKNDPTLYLDGPSTICEGDNTFANASSSGSWSSSDESIATINSTGVITGVSGGNATISFVSNVGCAAILNTPVTVINNPVVIREGPAEICINSTTTLSPTTGGIWVSSNNSVATVSSNGTVTGKASGIAEFSFIELTNGCLSDESISTTVYGPPSINGLSTIALCIGETASITPSSGGTWASTDVSVATIDDNGIITAVEAGSARFVFTSNVTGCSSAHSAPLIVNGNPSINFTGLTTICKGEQSSISPTSGGQWSSTDVTVATISQNGTITSVNQGTVSFIFMNDLNACSSALSTPLTVEEPTAITLTGPSTICINEITAILPNSGGTWSSSNVNIASISNNGEIVGHNPGIVTFTFDSNTACTSDPSIGITVVSNPVIEFLGPSEICIRTTTNLSPSEGGTWTSSNISVATVDDTGLVTAIGFGTVKFTFENTSTGCERTTDGVLSVYTKPVPEIVGNDEICIGFSTHLTPSSGGTWASSNRSVAVISSNGQVTGVSPGSVTFTFYETGSNCVSDASAPVTVLQKVPVSISGDNTICAGETTLVLPNTGGSWISNDPGVATITNAGVVTGISQGVVKFTFVSDGGCESNETSPVIVYGPQSVLINGPSHVCIDEQVQMLPSSGGTWISNNTSIVTIDSNGLATAIAPGEVNFTFTDEKTGCKSDPSGNITVSENPTTGLNGPSDICIGSVTYLTPSTGGIWTALDPGIATIQNNGQVSGVSPGVARFIFTQLGTGCDSEGNNEITINSGPVINFTGPSSICEREITNITSTNPGTWESTNPLIATITNDGLITGVSAGSVKFRFTDASSGCISDISETLIVNGPPTVSLAGSSTVCIGSTISLSPETGGLWESLTPAIATVTENGIVTGVAEGIAFFIFTDALTGCKSDGNLSVDVASAIGAQITGDSEICSGYTTRLFPNSGGLWTSSNTAVATVSNFGIVTGKAPGIVTFTFVDSNNGCSEGGTTDPITVSNCLNHDFNVALVDQNISGDISTNDNFGGGVTYSNIKVTVERPFASLAELIINNDGTYTFVTNKPGKYLYEIPVCIPPTASGCPSTFLEINVIDNVYGQSNPVSNLEFATTYANLGGTMPRNTITVNPLSNDDCVYTAGCNLDNTTLAIIDSPENGSVALSGTGSFDYTPNPGFIGYDTIEYEVCESAFNCSHSRQIITVNAPNALNSVVAADDFAYTLKGIAKSGNVADNDLDPENDQIYVSQQGSFMSPILISEGSYYINIDGSYEFMPNESFSGALEIIYTVCDNNAEVACTDATIHIQVFDDLSLRLRVYIEGSLIQNGDQTSVDGRPLMRDGLRVSKFTGENYIPVRDPYTYGNELYDDTPVRFVKVGPGLMADNLEILDSVGIFSVTGDNAIVDWIHVELRDKNDNKVTIATRSGLLQRDGDIVDLDGISLLRFQGINIDSFYVCVRHRTHLGVMSEKVGNGEFVDFTSPETPTFNFGTSLSNGIDYKGLSQKSNVKNGYLALWGGDFNSDGQLKFTEPASDINILYGNVLFSSPEFLINYDFALDYFKGDYNMDGKAKYSNPNDDRNYLQGQIIFHPLNINFISNLDGVIQQIPN
jgi:uncharacterized protein YjdB